MKFLHKIKKMSSVGIVLTLLIVFSITMFKSEDVYAKDEDGNIVIVIDPGHGGDDPGKVGVNGVHEEDANYEIAKAMMAELKKYDNVKVYMTRADGDWMTNTGRAMVGVDLYADFIVCLHNNSGSADSTGAIVFTSVLPLYSTITADVGNNILNNLAMLGIKSNGIQTRTSTQYEGEDYYTIMAEGMRGGVPTVLVEHCFLSNATDSLFVSHEDGTIDYDKCAGIGQADASALITYFNLRLKNETMNGQTISLERGYAVRLYPSADVTGTPIYSSSNSDVVNVDQYGLATANKSGTTTITYTAGDVTGSITINVKVPSQVALVGFLDPTFYETEAEFNAIKAENVMANIIYSDGSVMKVKPESVGKFDTTKVGVQDVPITYGTLEGRVRVIYTPADYVPEEVTSREPLPEKETVIETITENPNVINPTTQADDNGESTLFDIAMLIKLLIGVVVIIIFGTIIFIIENKLNNKRRNNRRRRY